LASGHASAPGGLAAAYAEVYERENLNPEDFTVILPIGSIRTASFFDHNGISGFLGGIRAKTNADDTAAASRIVSDWRAKGASRCRVAEGDEGDRLRNAPQRLFTSEQ
jgi:hypothetical protein